MNNKIVFTLLVILTTCSVHAKDKLASAFSNLSVGDTLVWDIPIRNGNYHTCWGNHYDRDYSSKSNKVTFYLKKEHNSQVSLNLATDFCEVKDSGKMTVVPDVSTTDSLSLIKQLFSNEDNDRAGSQLLHAMALHNAPEVRDLLKQQVNKPRFKTSKKDAIFWYALTADSTNYSETIDDLMALLKDETKRSLQEHIIFSLSQIDEGKGLDSLVTLIRTSDEINLQQKALFWLAHSDEDRAMPILEELLSDSD